MEYFAPLVVCIIVLLICFFVFDDKKMDSVSKIILIPIVIYAIKLGIDEKRSDEKIIYEMKKEIYTLVIELLEDGEFDNANVDSEVYELLEFGNDKNE